MTGSETENPAAARLLDEIERDFAFTTSSTGERRLDPAVRQALLDVPRDAFVPEDLRDEAFANHPLPIGQGQTISQPFIVALMTQLLKLTSGSRVLEIGTGSGYQAAVLAQLADSVYTVESVPALGERAARLFTELGWPNIHTRIGNGCRGWPEHAPYDAILVTAAAPSVPQALLEQLAPDGRLVAPVGHAFGQTLVLVEKDEQGRTRQQDLLAVAFVPLVDRNPDSEPV